MYSKFFVEKVHSFSGHRDCVYTLEKDIESNFFFSAGGDGMVVRWNSENHDQGELIAKLPNSIYALHLLDDKDLLAVAQNREGIHLLDWKKRKELKSIKLSNTYIFDIKSHRDNLFISSGDGSITIVNSKSLKIISKSSDSKASARTIAINGFSNEIAVGYSDCFIRIFDLTTLKKKHQWEAHQNSVFTLAYSPDGKKLVSGSRDAKLKSWNVDQQYQLHQVVAAHLYAINHVAFSPDGIFIATASMDKSIKIWQADELKLLKVIDRARHAGHGTSVNKLQWMKDAYRIVSASDDRSISLWKFQELK
jgi:WD40 repeat protein